MDEYDITKLPEQLQENICVDPSSECWMWTAHRFDNGYGDIWIDGVHAKAHRVVYEVFLGPLPPFDEVELHHTCEMRHCVNPQHLHLVTRQRHMEIDRRHDQLRSKTHCVHGHAFTPENTYIRPNGRRRCKECHNVNNRLYRRQRLLQA